MKSAKLTAKIKIYFWLGVKIADFGSLVCDLGVWLIRLGAVLIDKSVQR